jgi:carbonic anhydrase/acetyltransferase-like protein (isoleucine patch superfamily)
MTAYELANQIQEKYLMMGFPEEAVIKLREQADLIKKLEKQVAKGKKAIELLKKRVRNETTSR